MGDLKAASKKLRAGALDEWMDGWADYVDSLSTMGIYMSGGKRDWEGINTKWSCRYMPFTYVENTSLF